VVFAALEDVVAAFPFPILGIDSDCADLWIMPTWSLNGLRGNGFALAMSA
jgi:hypothetical protein